MSKKENRMFEVRAAEGDKMIVEGYAIVFDAPATHFGFTEIVDKNALSGADMKDVPLKYNHSDEHLIMARTRNNSLSLVIDDHGLLMRAELIDTTSNRDIYTSVQAGLLDKMSFAFTTAKDEWDYDTDTRRILGIEKLYDVSIVDVPFYDQTSVGARFDNSEDVVKEYKRKKQKKYANEIQRKLLIADIERKLGR